MSPPPPPFSLSGGSWRANKCEGLDKAMPPFRLAIFIWTSHPQFLLPSTHLSSLGFPSASESSSPAWSCPATSPSSSPGRRTVGPSRSAWVSPSTTSTSPAPCVSLTSHWCTTATTPASRATRPPPLSTGANSSSEVSQGEAAVGYEIQAETLLSFWC